MHEGDDRDDAEGEAVAAGGDLGPEAKSEGDGEEEEETTEETVQTTLPERTEQNTPPIAVDVTLTETVQEALAASETPESATEVLPTPALTIPPGHVVEAAVGAATTIPLAVAADVPSTVK